MNYKFWPQWNKQVRGMLQDIEKELPFFRKQKKILVLLCGEWYVPPADVPSLSYLNKGANRLPKVKTNANGEAAWPDFPLQFRWLSIVIRVTRISQRRLAWIRHDFLFRNSSFTTRWRPKCGSSSRVSKLESPLDWGPEPPNTIIKKEI